MSDYNLNLSVESQTFLLTSNIFSICNFHTFSIPRGHFGQIEYFFKVLKTNYEIQYFFNTFNTAWEPWRDVIRDWSAGSVTLIGHCIHCTSTQDLHLWGFLKVIVHHINPQFIVKPKAVSNHSKIMQIPKKEWIQVIGNFVQHIVHICHCCDEKSQVAFAQSFALWQQATIEITRRDHYYCLFVPHIVFFFTHIPFVVNRTFNATPPERLQHHQHNRPFCNILCEEHDLLCKMTKITKTLGSSHTRTEV